MPGVYGGDDVSAIVLDAGSSTFRAGWAGDDTPRSVVPTSYSWLPDNSSPDVEMSEANVDDSANTPKLDEKWTLDKGQRRRRFVGEAGVAWRAGAEIDSPLTDGMLTSPAAYLALAQHSLHGLLGANAAEHPLLLTEPAWASRESREEMTELAFEALNVPAFYLANATVLSSFAAGKPTSLLLDVGATHTSAIPVVDGFVLRKGIRRAPGLGGEAVSRALLYDLSTSAPLNSPRSGGLVNIVPHYMVKSKSLVGAGVSASAVLRTERSALTTDSYATFARMRVLHEAKESLAQVLDMPWDHVQAAARPARPFEFPDGYNDAFGVERFRAAEVLFSPEQLWADKPGVLPTGTGSVPPSIAQLVLDAINSVDVDSRPALFSNIVCVGGGTCVPGFNDRLSYTLGVGAPGQKVKIHSPGNTVERRYSSWLGGSILASLGTFHQLWVSKQEYEEHGAAVVHARCR